MNPLNFPPGCYPVGYFKTRLDQTCLATQGVQFGNINHIYRRTCTGESVELWAWINSTYICSTLKKKCLTVSSSSNWDSKLQNKAYTKDLFLEFTDYSTTMKYQQWKIDRNGEIVSVGAFGTCLSDESIFNFGAHVESRILMAYHTEVDCSTGWSFNPILNTSGLPTCSEFKF